MLRRAADGVGWTSTPQVHLTPFALTPTNTTVYHNEKPSRTCEIPDTKRRAPPPTFSNKTEQNARALLYMCTCDKTALDHSKHQETKCTATYTRTDIFRNLAFLCSRFERKQPPIDSHDLVSSHSSKLYGKNSHTYIIQPAALAPSRRTHDRLPTRRPFLLRHRHVPSADPTTAL